MLLQLSHCVARTGCDAVYGIELEAVDALLQLDVGAQIAHVPNGGFDVGTCLFRLPAVVDDGCLTNALQETIDAFRRVPTAHQVGSHRYFQHAEPS